MSDETSDTIDVHEEQEATSDDGRDQMQTPPDNIDVVNDDQHNDDKLENDISLPTPNNQQPTAITSFADVFIDEINEPGQLLQIIRGKSNPEASSAILNTLVDGDFDVDKNYVIGKAENLQRLFSMFAEIQASLQAEILSLLIGIMRKSERNLLMAMEAQLFDYVLELLNNSDDVVVTDLLIDLLTVITSLTITSQQFKLLLRYLKTDDQVWKKHAVKILDVIRALPHRHGPDEFFNFPGRQDSGLVLPPLKNWPYQNGFTFNTWFRIDPVANGVIEKEKPYLYWFCTSKGHGYTANFVGNCLAISCLKAKEKKFHHCIPFDFKPREWYMITIAYQYQRWSKSSIQCYVNGNLISTAFFPWSIETGEVFEKCYIGCTPDNHELTSFSGQLSTIYLFNTYLDSNIISGLFRLGSAYNNQFKFENESAHILSEQQRQAMYDGKLMNSIVFNYNAASCEEKLVFQSGPKSCQIFYVHNAHAQMLSRVRSIRTYSIYSTLHSIGGVQVFFPLFDQFDHRQFDGSINYRIASTIILTICQLIERSYTIQHQMISSKGFLVLGYHLERASKAHITMDVLNAFISLATLFVKFPTKTSPILLKHLFVQIFFHPPIWISCSVDIQMRLYTYLATEFVTYAEMYQSIQPISGLIQTLHTLKYFYWIEKPSDQSTIRNENFENRPNRDQILEIRRFMILYMKQLVISSPGTQEEELRAILNYLHTTQEDENVIDVLEMTVNLMSEHSATMVPAFDNSLGLRTVFKLLTSSNELTRLQALKLFGFFLQRSTLKRKTDAMQPYNLFSLLADRLLVHINGFTMSTYNILFEILVERVGGPLVEKRTTEINSDWKIENPAMIKVIGTLLRSSSDNINTYDIKYRFLDDLILLSSVSRENRRIILQMSVWQEYLLGLAYVYPGNDQQNEITDRVFELLKILLHHAIKFEFGGWRVWIDTLAILHGRITKEDYYRKTNAIMENIRDHEEIELKTSIASRSETPVDSHTAATPTKSNSNRQLFSQTNHLPPFSITGFKYSPMHIRLLNQLFDAIEVDVRSWKCDPTRPVTEAINHSDNQTFSSNIVHVISQMSDVLSNACGGLLPLLASTTSATHEMEFLENSEGLTQLESLQIMKRLMSFVDLFIIANSSNFHDLEQEKTMTAGGIVRQSLRLVMTMAVRHCMECRYQRFNLTSKGPEPQQEQQPKATSNSNKKVVKDPLEIILESTYLMKIDDHEDNDQSLEALIDSFIKNPQSVLQDIDIHRLRAILYRDVDDTKQSQFLALSTIYFASVLMVSRYRDIIESKQAPLSRTGSFNGSVASTVRQASSIDANNDFSNTNGHSSMSNFLNSPSNLNDTTISEQIEDNDQTDAQSVDGQSIGTNATVYASLSSLATADASNSTNDPKNESKLPDYPKATFNNAESGSVNISEKLERTLCYVAPFLRDLLNEFSAMLSKTLVGSHGQELLQSGLNALKKSASVIELVMLLCSQEWQNSLQKHAGLAFIELANEGRALAEASKDHVVKVANEADFILNRMRADDIRKAGEFEQLLIETTQTRQNEENLSDHFLCSSRQRYSLIGLRLKEKCVSLMINQKENYLHSEWPFLKLDAWEDDLRRRRRLVRNPNGSKYEEIEFYSTNSNETPLDTSVQERFLLKQSKLQQKQKNQNVLPINHEEEDLSQINEDDLDMNFIGPIRFSTACSLVCGTLALSGTLSMTQTSMHFDVDENNENYIKLNQTIIPYVEYLHGKWLFTEIRAIFSRRYFLQDRALEIFVSNRTSVMFAFADRATVKNVVACLPKVGVGGRYGLPQQRRTSLASPKQLFRSANMTQRWQRREISNFEYLMYLNTIAGRTYQDYNQYPIFPWIIADYESEKLDLNSPNTYRDLSKPIGALNPTRKSFFVERYNNWESDVIPSHHYETHYSSANSTLYWLIRLEPFTAFYLYDSEEKTQRPFHSIPEAWQNCQRDSSDVKELIPEFFSLPEMFENCNQFELGQAEDQSLIDDVLLPKWASSPEDFIRINRTALESEFVSCHLHHWIDLIFGYKQRGPEAIRATNVFYYLTYEGFVNLDSITNPVDRQLIERKIRSLGQIPCQLLTEPHPPRNSPLVQTTIPLNGPIEDVSMIMKFSSNAPIVHVAANTNPNLPSPAVLTISTKHDFSINKYNQNATSSSQTYQETIPLGTTQTNNLPLSMDTLFTLNTGLHRRHLGENFDERIHPRHQSFVVTGDNRFIISTGYWDKSFRVQNTDMAKTTQVLYGHFDLVTCICRSEMTLSGNCFIATGSRDCTVCIWIWNGTKGAIVDKEYPTQEINPSPAAILRGHEKEITCLWISAELGIVLSGSEHGFVLEHTLQGDILRSFDSPQEKSTPRLLYPSVDGDIVVCFDRSCLCLYTLNGKMMKQAIFEDEIIQSLTLNNDSQYAVIGGDRGFVQILRTHDLQPIYVYPQCDASIRSLAITHDQKFIMAGLSTGCIIVFNVNFAALSYQKRDQSSVTKTNSTNATSNSSLFLH